MVHTSGRSTYTDEYKSKSNAWRSEGHRMANTQPEDSQCMDLIQDDACASENVKTAFQFALAHTSGYSTFKVVCTMENAQSQG
jgi:hypothetical protein